MGFARLRGFHPDRRRDQPGQLGRRADQQRAASWSASTPASTARAAATRASASRCRATWRSAIVDDLMKYGEVRRGSIGYIGIEKLTPQLAEEVGVAEHERRARVAHDAARRRPTTPGSGPATSSSASTASRSTTRRSSCAWWPTRSPASTAVVKVLRDGRTLEFKLPIVSSVDGTRPRCERVAPSRQRFARRVPRFELLERAAQPHRRRQLAVDRLRRSCSRSPSRRRRSIRRAG